MSRDQGYDAVSTEDVLLDAVRAHPVLRQSQPPAYIAHPLQTRGRLSRELARTHLHEHDVRLAYPTENNDNLLSLLRKIPDIDVPVDIRETYGSLVPYVHQDIAYWQIRTAQDRARIDWVDIQRRAAAVPGKNQVLEQELADIRAKRCRKATLFPRWIVRDILALYQQPAPPESHQSTAMVGQKLRDEWLRTGLPLINLYVFGLLPPSVYSQYNWGLFKTNMLDLKGRGYVPNDLAETVFDVYAQRENILGYKPLTYGA